MSDLISKQAAIEYFQRVIDATNTDGRYNLGFIDGLEFCINHLSTMSSAQPAQKGKWIDIDSETYMWMIKCDKCGHLRSMMSTNGIYPKFCENCGADMRG